MEGSAISVVAWILNALIAVPAIYLSLVSGYLLVIAGAAYGFWKKTNTGAPPMRFALVLPAHNEEGQIETILDDAAHLDYARDQYTVFVIADNCTDRTAALAREAGATVLERSDTDRRGKGQALDWFLHTQRNVLEQYDAISIIDADMRIDPDYLRELSATLSWPGCQVAQASNMAAHPEANWRAALGYLGFTVVNHVRPAGRAALGGTAELKGSGMAFRTALLLRYGWPAQSLAEDAEFSKQLLLDGVLVHYNPDAKVTSELAASHAQAEVQQSRWEGGKIYIFRKYLPLLLRRAIAKPAWRHWDALLDLVTPPQTVLFLALISMWSASWLAHPAWTLLLTADAAAVTFCVLSGPILCRAPLRIWLYFAAAPVLVAWKAPMLLKLLLRKAPAAWQRTPRRREAESGSQK